jgi:DNA primase
MSIFQTIKQSLNLIDVAKHYGIEVSRSGFTSCLFHNERTPSLKLYSDHFHCFGCGKSGDVIALVAQRLNISQFESAKLLMNDFHLSQEEMKLNAVPQVQRSYSEWERQTIRLLTQYRDYLQHFEKIHSPKTPDEPIHNLFVEAIHTLPKIEYYLDILTFEPLEIRREFLQEYVKQLDEIEVKLDEYKRTYPRSKNRNVEGVCIFEE